VCDGEPGSKPVGSRRLSPERSADMAVKHVVDSLKSQGNVCYVLFKLNFPSHADQ